MSEREREPPPPAEGLRAGPDPTDKWWDRSGPGARYRRWVALGIIVPDHGTDGSRAGHPVATTTKEQNP